MFRHPSSRDPNQIVQYSHDEDQNAQRVVLVGGDFGIAEAVKESLKDFKIDLISQPSAPQFWPNEIEKEVIVKEYVTLTVPQIIKEQEFKVIETERLVTIIEPRIIEIEKPILIKETEVKVIEQQVIIKEVKDLDKLIKLLLIAQAVTLVIVLLKTFI